jgi:MraZ protein
MRRFLGKEEVRVDDKGRFPIPIKFRELLLPEDEETFFVQPGIDGELVAYPKSYFLALEKRLEEPIPFNQTQRMLNRNFYNDTEVCTLDRQGRITIPQSLRDAHGIVGAVVVAGSREWLDIWNAARYAGQKEKEKDQARKAAGERMLISAPPARPASSAPDGG